MKNVHQLIPFGTLIAGAAVASIVVTLEGQTPAPVGDFRNATLAQVRDAQGQVVLQGHFAHAGGGGWRSRTARHSCTGWR